MVPVFKAAGVAQAGIAALAVPWPVGHAKGDFGVLYVQTSNEAVAAPSGWTEFPNSPQGTGPAATAGSVRLTVFYKFATSAVEPDVTVADSGDHQLARIVTFSAVRPTTGGLPYDITAGDTAASSTSVSIPGGTTTLPDCLIYAMVADAFDSAGANRATGPANASLTNVTEQTDHGTTSGTGGGVTSITGTKTTAGAVSATTCTLGTASAQARIMVALVGDMGHGVGDGVGHTNGHVVGHT